MNNILPIGIVKYRNKELKFGLYSEDRRKHLYVIGKTGQGKTTLIENMIIHDLKNNNGLAFLDPHGDSVQKILDFIPKERMDDVIYFNPADVNHPIGFNPLEKVSWEQRHIAALSLLSVFKKIWVDAWSARMEYILTNTLLALLEWPQATLLDVNRMLADQNFRKNVIAILKDEVVKSFWLNEFEKYHTQFRTEAVAPIQNKIGQFITNPIIRNIIGQSESQFDLREIIDDGKIFLANLSVGAIGEESSFLLGGLLITKFQLAAMSRIDIPEEKRKDFYLYIDEFQNFATESFIKILSEARKYRLSLIIAHQYLDQVSENIIKAIFGNVGNFIVFRLGPNDAQIFSKEFAEIVSEDNLVNLPAYYAYVKILVKGSPTNPFLILTFPPIQKPELSFREEIINFNHLKYAKRRSLIEAKIAKIYKEIKEDKEITYCSQCHQPFYSSGEEICEECQEKQTSKISLKTAIEKNLLVKEKELKKENQKEKELSIDEILKKLSNNES